MVPAEVIMRASRMLKDQEPGHAFVTWTESDLMSHLNEGLCTVFNFHPMMFVENVELELAAGSSQKLPSGYGELISIDSNLAPGACPGSGKPVNMSQFDMVKGLRGKKTCVTAECTPYEVAGYRKAGTGVAGFFVEPPVPCGPAVTVEATVTKRPERIEMCDRMKALDLPCELETPLLDWILYRAYEVDAESQYYAQMARRHQAAFYDWVNGTYLVDSRVNSGYVLGQRGSGEERTGWRNEGRQVGR